MLVHSPEAGPHKLGWIRGPLAQLWVILSFLFLFFFLKDYAQACGPVCLHVQNTRLSGIYIPPREAFTNDWCRSMKVQLLCFDLGQILGCTFHSRAPCRIRLRLGLTGNQPLWCLLCPASATPHQMPWEHFLNQSLAHKSLAPSGGLVVSGEFVHHSCSVNICCLSE